jgi:hypothetical protein
MRRYYFPAGAKRIRLAAITGIEQYAAWPSNPTSDHSPAWFDGSGSAVTQLTHADSEEQEPAFTHCRGACP